MSFITEIKLSAPPANDVHWDKQEFPSPNHSWLAVFHDPYEWHMGATGWKLSVVSSETKSAINSSNLEKLSNDKGLACPLDYVPWSVDSKILALLFWESGLVFFDPSSNTYRTQDSFPQIIQWSPNSDHLLTFAKGQFLIWNSAGTRLTQIDWKMPEFEPPHIGWLKSEKIFFAIGRSSKTAKPKITFIDVANGTTISEEPLDPEKLVPYNASRYKHIARDKYSLYLSTSSSSRRAAGYLLDIWDDVIYDQDKGIILLSIYRPVNKLFAPRGTPACEVKKEWVSVKLYA